MSHCVERRLECMNTRFSRSDMKSGEITITVRVSTILTEFFDPLVHTVVLSFFNAGCASSITWQSLKVSVEK